MHCPCRWTFYEQVREHILNNYVLNKKTYLGWRSSMYARFMEKPPGRLLQHHARKAWRLKFSLQPLWERLSTNERRTNLFFRCSFQESGRFGEFVCCRVIFYHWFLVKYSGWFVLYWSLLFGFPHFWLLTSLICCFCRWSTRDCCSLLWPPQWAPDKKKQKAFFHFGILMGH